MDLWAKLLADLDRLRHQSARPLLAFSGGKDSLLLRLACQEIGWQMPSVFARTQDLEWPQHLAYVDGFANVRAEIVPLTFSWLAEHPAMLFPADSRTRNRWFDLVQRGAVRRAAARCGADMVLWGRRNQENTVRADVYRLDSHLVAAPLRRWRTDEVLAELAGRGIPLSPLYNLPLAQERGVHRWPTRRPCAAEPDPWATVARYAPAVVREAAHYFPEASRWL